MLNGDGLRVVLWVSGCTHQCPECQNPITWDLAGGLPFDEEAENELFDALKPAYVSGITFSGGDPLHPFNQGEITRLAKKFKELEPEKTAWLYTGFSWENIKDLDVMKYIDVVVDGECVADLKDNNLHWIGSANQRVIDVQKSLERDEIVLHEV